MTRPHRRVVLHVGLAQDRDDVPAGRAGPPPRRAARGRACCYPFVRPQAMFLGAVEVRGSREKFGLSEADVAGTWQALCDRVPRPRRHQRASATRSSAAPSPTRSRPPCVPWPVSTSTSWSRPATSGGRPRRTGRRRSSSATRGRSPTSSATSSAPTCPPARDRTSGTPRTTPPRCGAGRRRSRPIGCTWSTCPPPGAAVRRAVATVRRRVRDRRTASSTPPPSLPANPSLTTEAIALLRAVNAELDGRITPREHASAYVKRELAEGRLARPPGYAAPGARLPRRRPACRRPPPGAATSRRTGIPSTVTSPTSRPCWPRPETRTRTPYRHGVPDPDEVATLAREVLGEPAPGRVDSGHEGTGNSGSAALPLALVTAVACGGDSASTATDPRPRTPRPRPTPPSSAEPSESAETTREHAAGPRLARVRRRLGGRRQGAARLQGLPRGRHGREGRQPVLLVGPAHRPLRRPLLRRGRRHDLRGHPDRSRRTSSTSR